MTDLERVMQLEIPADLLRTQVLFKQCQNQLFELSVNFSGPLILPFFAGPFKPKSPFVAIYNGALPHASPYFSTDSRWATSKRGRNLVLISALSE